MSYHKAVILSSEGGSVYEGSPAQALCDTLNAKIHALEGRPPEDESGWEFERLEHIGYKEFSGVQAILHLAIFKHH